MKYNVIDLFAGAGGFGFGFQLSGSYNIKCSLEIDKWASESIMANKVNGHEILHADIRDFKSHRVIKSAASNQDIHVVIGGPPCQGFSNQGLSTKKDANDPRNSLFVDFARWVKHIEPEVFVMENVTGILSRMNSSGEKVIDIIKKTFKEIGYKVTIWKLNAANYGVPQLRERIFIVGNKYEEPLSAPKKSHFIWKNDYDKKKLTDIDLKPAITTGQAIWDLPLLRAGQGEERQFYTRKTKNNYQIWARDNQEYLYNHVAMRHTSRLVERFKNIQNGIALVDQPNELKVRKRGGNGSLSEVNFNSNYRHLKSSKISYTIPASFYSSFIHPFQPRNITTREAARIQSFPDSYVFKGKRTVVSSKLLKKIGKEDQNHLSQYNQVGNAVPPLLAKAIADRIKEFLDNKNSMTKKQEPFR